MISVLITTFNRKELLQRAIESVLTQTYTDLELIIIDDCSQDGTDRLPILQNDSRIKYHYYFQNLGQQHGDRVHMKRFVNHMAKGKYFAYLPSDDYWIPKNLLARQVALLEAYPDAAIVTGGQMSYFYRPNEQVMNESVPEGEEKFYADAMPNGYMDSDSFLDYFATHPHTTNINRGAALFKRDLFIKSGALQGDGGKWEGGFEITIAPCCYGGHIYINEPCVFTTIREDNASFQGTQLLHYQDSIDSIKAGFRQALKDFPQRELEKVQKKIIDNVGKSYLANAHHIKTYGSLSMCSKENIARPVTMEDLCLS